MKGLCLVKTFKNYYHISYLLHQLNHSAPWRHLLYHWVQLHPQQYWHLKMVWRNLNWHALLLALVHLLVSKHKSTCQIKSTKFKKKKQRWKYLYYIFCNKRPPSYKTPSLFSPERWILILISWNRNEPWLKSPQMLKLARKNKNNHYHLTITPRFIH